VSDTKALLEEVKKLLNQASEIAERQKQAKDPLNEEQLKRLIEEAVKKERGTIKPENRKLEFNADGVIDPRTKHLPVEVQKKLDEIYIVSRLLGVHPKETKIYHQYFAEGSELRKAMDTATSGSGAEWIPTGFSQAMIDEVKLNLKVAALHPRIDMPTPQYKIPALRGGPTAYLASENTAVTESSVTTGNVLLDAKTLKVYIPWSDELDEDSLIPMLPLLRGEMAQALAEAIEDATINGDTDVGTGSATDSDMQDPGDATNPRAAWNGYREVALASAKVDLATFSDANVRSIRKGMGVYGVDPSNLAWVTGIAGYNKMMSDLTDVRTMDKYGDKAVVLQGELAKYDGIPIIVSEKIREDLNASGVYDGVTTDKTLLLLVYRPGFLYGDRRNITIEQDKDIVAGTIKMVASQRLDFKARYDTSTEALVGVGYNVAT